MPHGALTDGPETGDAMARALAAGRIGTWHWDTATDAVLWDGTLCGIYGLGSAEAPRTAPDFLGCVAPEDRDATVRTVSLALEGAAYLEHRFHAATGGRTFWVHDRAHVIRDRDARSTSMIGMCCDSGSKRAPVAPSSGPMAEHPPVDLAAYLGAIVESLRRDPRTGERRPLQYEAAPIVCPFDRAVKLALILLELVAPVGATAAASSRGHIVVSLQSLAETASLSVGAHRLGEPEPAPQDAATVLGIQTAMVLARQLGGTLTGRETKAARSVGTPRSSRLWRLDFPLHMASA